MRMLKRSEKKKLKRRRKKPEYRLTDNVWKAHKKQSKIEYGIGHASDRKNYFEKHIFHKSRTASLEIFSF